MALPILCSVARKQQEERTQHLVRNTVLSVAHELFLAHTYTHTHTHTHTQNESVNVPLNFLMKMFSCGKAQIHMKVLKKLEGPTNILFPIVNHQAHVLVTI